MFKERESHMMLPECEVHRERETVRSLVGGAGREMGGQGESGWAGMGNYLQSVRTLYCHRAKHSEDSVTKDSLRESWIDYQCLPGTHRKGRGSSLYFTAHRTLGP